MVFHLVTDSQNFYAFKSWYIRNAYKGATINVLNFEYIQLQNLGNGEVEQLSPYEEFRITSHSNVPMLNTLLRTEYISMFGHSLFLLPGFFSNLKRVIVLEDDTIVQRDLSFLWNLDLKGKVIGAVQFCGVRFGQLRAYLHDFPYNSSSCLWMSGVSVIDLDKWREHDVTAIHHQIQKKVSLVLTINRCQFPKYFFSQTCRKLHIFLSYPSRQEHSVVARSYPGRFFYAYTFSLLNQEFLNSLSDNCAHTFNSCNMSQKLPGELQHCLQACLFFKI